MNTKAQLASQAISRIFTNSGGYSAQQVREIAFHLTDWLDDLKPFADFVDDPGKYSDDEAMQFFIRFLTHVPDHLRIAAEHVLNPDE